MAKHKTAEHVLGEEEARKLKPDQDGVVNIENGVTEIGFRAFRNRKDVKKIRIPKSVKTIAAEAFRGSGLEGTLEISETVVEVKSGAFRECKNLKTVIFKQKKLKKNRLEDEMFMESGIEAVSIPNTVTVIGINTFSGCKNLKKITLPKNLKIISKNAFSSSGLERVSTPETVTRIGESAFDSCRFLQTAILRKGLESIGDYAFFNSGLWNVSVPESVTDIGKNAFVKKGGQTISFPIQ